jgi:hypothetical protein
MHSAEMPESETIPVPPGDDWTVIEDGGSEDVGKGSQVGGIAAGRAPFREDLASMMTEPASSPQKGRISPLEARVGQ